MSVKDNGDSTSGMRAVEDRSQGPHRREKHGRANQKTKWGRGGIWSSVF